MKTFFDFSMPLQDNSLLTTVRLCVGGLASAAGLDVDEVEDFKVCVTESLLLFKRNGYSLAKAHFETEENSLRVKLLADGKGEKAENADLEDEISFALLGALVDEANFDKGEDGRFYGVTLVKNR